MVFGSYDVMVTTPLDTTGNIVFRCTQRDHNIQITVSRGSAPSFAARLMVNNSEQLIYNLYLDAARTIIWGDGSGGSQAFFARNPQGNNQDIIVPLYGRIPARQDRGIGAYADTVIVTLNF
jgi:spore coat protein U-like protein